MYIAAGTSRSSVRHGLHSTEGVAVVVGDLARWGPPGAQIIIGSRVLVLEMPTSSTQRHDCCEKIRTSLLCGVCTEI